MKIRWMGVLKPDPSVIGTARLGQDGGAQKALRDLFERLGLNGCDEAVLEIVKQRYGQRATIRIDAGARRRYYVKLLRSAGGERRIEETGRIADAAEGAGVIVPRPIAWLPRLRALVTPQVEGEPLLRASIRRGAGECAGVATGREAGLPARAGGETDGMAATGRALARIHAALPPPALVRTRAFERERIGIARGEMGRSGPAMLPLFDGDAARWTSDEPRGPEETVGIHGDFYPDQVLLHAGDRIAILDWDNACSGEAERDVGNFVAHVILEEERGALVEATPLVTAFLGGYASAAKRLPRPDVLAWYTAGSLLRVAALHADPEFGSRPPNDPDLPGRLLDRARTVDPASFPGIAAGRSRRD